MPVFAHTANFNANKKEIWNWYNSDGAFRRIMPEWEGIQPMAAGKSTPSSLFRQNSDCTKAGKAPMQTRVMALTSQNPHVFLYFMLWKPLLV